jgi:hypothetical protein
VRGAGAWARDVRQGHGGRGDLEEHQADNEDDNEAGAGDEGEQGAAGAGRRQHHDGGGEAVGEAGVEAAASSSEQQRGRERRRAGVQADMQADAQKGLGMRRTLNGTLSRMLASLQPPTAIGARAKPAGQAQDAAARPCRGEIALGTRPGPTAAITTAAHTSPRRRCRVQSRYPVLSYPILSNAVPDRRWRFASPLSDSPFPCCDNLWYHYPQGHQLSLSLSLSPPPSPPQSRNCCPQLPHCLGLSSKPTTRSTCSLHPPRPHP